MTEVNSWVAETWIEERHKKTKAFQESLFFSRSRFSLSLNILVSLFCPFLPFGYPVPVSSWPWSNAAEKVKSYPPPRSIIRPSHASDSCPSALSWTRREREKKGGKIRDSFLASVFLTIWQTDVYPFFSREQFKEHHSVWSWNHRFFRCKVRVRRLWNDQMFEIAPASSFPIREFSDFFTFRFLWVKIPAV